MSKISSEELQEASIVNKVLSAKVASVIAVVSLVVGITSYVNKPAQQNTEAINILQARIEKDESLNEQLVATLKNDTHSVGENQNKLLEQVIQLQKDIVQLQTIINERIPAKK